MTDTEKLILENQRVILHILRVMTVPLKLPEVQWAIAQDQMDRIEQFIAKKG